MYSLIHYFYKWKWELKRFHCITFLYFNMTIFLLDLCFVRVVWLHLIEPFCLSHYVTSRKWNFRLELTFPVFFHSSPISVKWFTGLCIHNNSTSPAGKARQPCWEISWHPLIHGNKPTPKVSIRYRDVDDLLTFGQRNAPRLWDRKKFMYVRPTVLSVALRLYWPRGPQDAWQNEKDKAASKEVKYTLTLALTDQSSVKPSSSTGKETQKNRKRQITEAIKSKPSRWNDAYLGCMWPRKRL